VLIMSVRVRLGGPRLEPLLWPACRLRSSFCCSRSGRRCRIVAPSCRPSISSNPPTGRVPSAPPTASCAATGVGPTRCDRFSTPSTPGERRSGRGCRGGQEVPGDRAGEEARTGVLVLRRSRCRTTGAARTGDPSGRRLLLLLLPVLALRRFRLRRGLGGVAVQLAVLDGAALGRLRGMGTAVLNSHSSTPLRS